MSHHQNTAEGVVDIGSGFLITIGTYFAFYGEHILVALMTGAAGTIASIFIRIIYKKWFKKYFE